MKTIVIYTSKTGYTKKYAEWIAEAVSAELVDVKNLKKQTLANYDCIIYGGRLYATGIDGISVITKNFDQLKDKHLFVFATGASLPSESVWSHVRDINFIAEQKDKINFYYYRGGFDYKGLPVFDRILMFLMKKRIQQKMKKGTPLEEDEIGMLELYDEAADFTDETLIADMVEAIKSLEN